MSSDEAQGGTTRRQAVAGAGALAGAGMLGLLPSGAAASHSVSTEDLLDVAATAEAVAAVVATVGQERGRASGDALGTAGRAVVEAAARADLTHFDVLVAPRVGGRPTARSIWVPDDVFASAPGLLRALVAVKDVLINAYLVGTTSFGNERNGRFARFTAEIAGVESVHRAQALEALGLFGADRVFLKYSQPEQNPDAPFFPRPGFRRIASALGYLEDAGFGLGRPGRAPGAFYDVDEVRAGTPNPAALNTRSPR